jgi:hypothetical protein
MSELKKYTGRVVIVTKGSDYFQGVPVGIAMREYRRKDQLLLEKPNKEGSIFSPYYKYPGNTQMWHKECKWYEISLEYYIKLLKSC